MRGHCITFFFFSFLILGCQPKTEDELTVEDSNFFSYPIDINARSVRFIDQVESLEVLGFEESNESLMKSEVEVFMYEEGYIVIDKNLGTVFLFNKDGTYKSKFNRKGQGPEEYPYLYKNQYRDGFIETYVENTEKLMTYDLKGNFIKSLKLPYPAAHVLHFNDGYLLGMGNQIGYDSITHDVIFTDKQMKPYAFALPFDKPNGVPITAPYNEFRLYRDKVLFNPFWTDSVYQIKENKVSPFIHFDFGKDWLWDEVPLSREFNTTIIEGKSKVWGYTWVMGQDRIEMTYMTSFERPPGLGYVNRRTKEFLNYKYDWSVRNQMPFTPLRFEDDKLLAIFTVDELGLVIDELGLEHVSSKGFLSEEQVLESENPILVWIKFKQ